MCTKFVVPRWIAGLGCCWSAQPIRSARNEAGVWFLEEIQTMTELAGVARRCALPSEIRIRKKKCIVED